MTERLRIDCDGICENRSALAADELATAAAFLRLLTPTATASYKSPGSYGLKHDAERWGRSHGMAPYVSNGALIAAAVALGLPIRRSRRDSPNVGVGVRLADLSRLRAAADLTPAGETWAGGR